MSAVVSGSGLGLYDATGSLQRQSNTGLGPNGDKIAINSVNGNLILQQQDEFLSSVGLDVPLIRTYNSQGLLNDDNQDNWRFNIHQTVSGLQGTVNTAGSTLSKTFGDGHEAIYTYDTTTGRYLNSHSMTEGSPAINGNLLCESCERASNVPRSNRIDPGRVQRGWRVCRPIIF